MARSNTDERHLLSRDRTSFPFAKTSTSQSFHLSAYSTTEDYIIPLNNQTNVAKSATPFSHIRFD